MLKNFHKVLPSPPFKNVRKFFLFALQIIKCWKLCLNKYERWRGKNYKCDFHRAIISNSCIFSLFLIGGKLSMNNILRHRLIPGTFLITRKIKDNPFFGCFLFLFLACLFGKRCVIHSSSGNKISRESASKTEKFLSLKTFEIEKFFWWKILLKIYFSRKSWNFVCITKRKCEGFAGAIERKVLKDQSILQLLCVWVEKTLIV